MALTENKASLVRWGHKAPLDLLDRKAMWAYKATLDFRVALDFKAMQVHKAISDHKATLDHKVQSVSKGASDFKAMLELARVVHKVISARKEVATVQLDFKASAAHKEMVACKA